MFKKAERKQAKLRLALSGPAGSGKTTGALMIAKGLGGKIAVLDTERGSASLYSDKFDFDVVELSPPYTPERYIEVVEAAQKAGYDILIIDSMTHEWNGPGGCLELNEQIARTKFRGNVWSAWNETTPRHRKFVDSILAANLHIIATMRSKTETIQTENGAGKKVVQKVGMKTEQRDGMDYEFTVVLDLTVDGHTALASKDRTRLFNDPFVITEDTGRMLANWLNMGKSFEDQAKDAAKMNNNSITSAQSSALMAYLTKRHGNNRDAYLAELSSFFGREISSSRELTRDDVSEFLDAINRPQQEIGNDVSE